MRGEVRRSRPARARTDGRRGRPTSVPRGEPARGRRSQRVPVVDRRARCPAREPRRRSSRQASSRGRPTSARVPGSDDRPPPREPRERATSRHDVAEPLVAARRRRARRAARRRRRPRRRRAGILVEPLVRHAGARVTPCGTDARARRPAAMRCARRGRRAGAGTSTATAASASTQVLVDAPRAAPVSSSPRPGADIDDVRRRSGCAEARVDLARASRASARASTGPTCTEVRKCAAGPSWPGPVAPEAARPGGAGATRATTAPPRRRSRGPSLLAPAHPSRVVRLARHVRYPPGPERDGRPPVTEQDAPPRLRVGIVGTGRAGAVLGAALARAGHHVVAAYAVSDLSRLRAEALLPGRPARAGRRGRWPAPTSCCSPCPTTRCPALVAGLVDDRRVPRRASSSRTPPAATASRVLDPATRAGALPAGAAPGDDVHRHAASTSTGWSGARSA